MPAQKLAPAMMARRASQEIRPGEVVAIGPGLPCLVPPSVPPDSGAWFLSEVGVIGHSSGHLAPSGEAAPAPAIVPGGAVVGVADVAAMLSGGNVGLAVIEAAQVSAAGDIVHWTTAETPGLAAPGFAVDFASGARRVVALMPHVDGEGNTRILEGCTLPLDGIRCVSAIVTDAAVLRVTHDGLELAEIAPGWTSGEVAAITGAPCPSPRLSGR